MGKKEYFNLMRELMRIVFNVSFLLSCIKNIFSHIDLWSLDWFLSRLFNLVLALLFGSLFLKFIFFLADHLIDIIIITSTIETDH